MATMTRAPAGTKPIPPVRKAEKRQVKLKLAIQGPSGSGKTKGALALAKNLWPAAKVLLVDTENESASLYADEFTFDTIPLDPPFESERYESCIDYAVANGYDVLICDTISHQWDGEGGILRRKEELDRRPGANSYTNWNAFTPEHTHFVEALKQAPIHIIATMRSKQDYILEQTDKGKSKPVKVGMAPIQRDGFEYEFTIVFDVQMDHRATISKNRTGLFEGKVLNLADKKVADQIRTWLESGKPADAPAEIASSPKPPATVHAAPAPHAAAAKVDTWKLDGDHLTCHVYDVQKKTSRSGNEFVAVKHNGQVNGKDVAFCWKRELFEAMLGSKGHFCTLLLEQGEYTNIIDVLGINGVVYRNGAPDRQEPLPLSNEAPIGDEDIPF